MVCPQNFPHSTVPYIGQRWALLKPFKKNMAMKAEALLLTMPAPGNVIT